MIPYTLTLPGPRLQTESIAPLIVCSVHNAKNAPRKSVDLGHSITLQPLILDSIVMMVGPTCRMKALYMYNQNM